MQNSAKKGNRDVLALFGYDDTTSINLQDFTLETTSISIGEDLTFSFNILAKKRQKQGSSTELIILNLMEKGIGRYLKYRRFH
ncbi:hypothetical protein [Clostridioides difficile]|uniref:hypothetical protein n=1 Tax=Clostridioides difficile TaxID=1496 RepID=UPI002ED01D0E